MESIIMLDCEMGYIIEGFIANIEFYCIFLVMANTSIDIVST